MQPRCPGRQLSFVAGAALLALGVLTASEQASKPNLLLVTLDTIRADHIGAYGYTQGATPALDRIAREGVRLADAITHAPLTAPAHAGILTGVYPTRYGVDDDASSPLPPDATTLAEVLAQSGYRTGAFVGTFRLDRTYGFAQGFETFDARFGPFDSADELKVERSADAVVQGAVAWIDSVPRGQPFFAWIHLNDARAPHAAPAPFRTRFRAQPYDGEIAYVDSAVARVLARLETTGVLDRTLIAAIGDHGESLGEHGEREHGLFLYDAVLHVPWLMRLPGRELAGTVVREQVRAIDLMPTVLGVLGIAAPAAIDGESLVGVVRGAIRRDPPSAYAETLYPATRRAGRVSAPRVTWPGTRGSLAACVAAVRLCAVMSTDAARASIQQPCFTSTPPIHCRDTARWSSHRAQRKPIVADVVRGFAA